MVRLKSSPIPSLKEINYADPALVFWFFGGQVPRKEKQLIHLPSKNLSPQPVPIENEQVKDKKKLLKPTNNGNAKDAPTVVNGTVDSGANQTSTEGSQQNKLSHPLSKFPEVPPLTDIQVMMTEAILSNGGTCTFDKIYEYVSQRWRNVRRRDGSNYTTDCKRAIQANLRHNPNHIALFRRDKDNIGNWTVCKTIDEAAEASHEKTSERKNKTKLEKQEKADSDEVGESEEDNGMKMDEDDTNASSDNGKQSIPEKQQSSDGINVTSPNGTFSESDSKAGDIKLNQLQLLVIECINDNSGSCHFDMIVHHVSKHWNSLPQKSSNTDIRSAILATLTDSKRIFKRDTKRTGWWMVNADVAASTILPKSIKEEASRRTRLNEKKNGKSEKSNSADSSSESPEQENSGEESNGSKGSNKDPPMTQLQVLIIEAIDDSEGGSATFDQIYDYVSKRFDTIKRRDGTPYTSDCRRAIQASLSNNPATRPFFKKETKKGVPYWSLAKRSIEFLEEHNSSKPSQSNNNNNDEVMENGESEEIIEDNEEEIHDEIEEDDDDDDNDEEEVEEVEEEEEESDTNGHSKSNGRSKSYKEDIEDSDKEEESTSKKNEQLKEDKHLYSNRVKRARRIKENAENRSSKRLRDEHL